MIAGVALLGGPAAVPAAAAPAAFTCDYSSVSWASGFSADLTVVNNGPAIDGWSVRLTFPAPAGLAGAWRAAITQTSPVAMTATNLPWNADVQPGGLVAFGWSATGTDTEPVITVNGVSC